MQISLSSPAPLHAQVGVTAMLIASKYEEIWAPEVRDFVYISDKAYTREQILTMEKVMLHAPSTYKKPCMPTAQRPLCCR